MSATIIQVIERQKKRKLFSAILAAVLGSGLGVIIGSEAIYGYDGGLISRMLYTPAQVAEMHAQDAMLAHIAMFRVACAAPAMTASEKTRWAAYATDRGWTPYPAGGQLCYDP